jgi:hypothetical protein
MEEGMGTGCIFFQLFFLKSFPTSLIGIPDCFIEMSAPRGDDIPHKFKMWARATFNTPNPFSF